MDARSWRRWIAVIVLLALFVRLGAVFALKRWDSATPGVYRQLAVSLVESGTFSFREHGNFGPSSVATPPYPMLLATIFRLFGTETPTAYFAALAFNAVLGAITAAVVATLVRRWLSPPPGTPGGGRGEGSYGHSETARAEMALPPTPSRSTRRGSEHYAVFAGLLIAVWPPQVFAATFAQPMALSALIVAAAALLWARSLVNHGLLTWAGFSIAIALAALLEPMLLIAFILLLLIIPFTRCWPADVRVRNLTVLLLAGVLLLLPWAARNRAVHGQWLLTTTLWQRAWFGANDNATGSDRLPLTPERRAAARVLPEADDDTFARVPMMQIDALPPEQRASLREQPEAAREKLFRQWSNDWFNSHSAAWIRQAPVRLLKCWWIDYDHPMSRNPLAIVPRSAAALGATIGVLLLLRRRNGTAAAMVILLATLGAAGATSASAKMTILIEPLQIALGLAAVGIFFRRLSGQTGLPAEMNASKAVA